MLSFLIYQLQNTREEKELFHACRTGDLETVKRLSNGIALHDVRDYSWSQCCPLHHAARLVWNSVLLFLYPCSTNVESCYVVIRALCVQ